MGHTLRIFLLRHAHVKEADYLGANADPTLSPKGKAQSEWLCHYFDAVPLERIISSPLKRAIQTVTPLAQSKSLCVAVESWLREYDDELFDYTAEALEAYGTELEMYPVADWRHFPSAVMLDEHDHEVHEGLTQLLCEYGLVKRGFHYHGALERDLSILLCGHVGSVTSVLGYFMNLHTVHCLLSTHADNISVSLFEIWQDDRLPLRPYQCRLRSWNQSSVER